MKKSTDDLMKILGNKNNYGDYIHENRENITNEPLHNELMKILRQKNLSKAAAITKTGIDRTYGYQIFDGRRKPSRDMLIRICIGLELTKEETRKLLLMINASPLYPRDKRDSIIIFGILHKISIIDINILLEEYGFEPI